jgi:hypothetical protein
MQTSTERCSASRTAAATARCAAASVAVGAMMKSAPVDSSWSADARRDAPEVVLVLVFVRRAIWTPEGEAAERTAGISRGRRRRPEAVFR